MQVFPEMGGASRSQGRGDQSGIDLPPSMPSLPPIAMLSPSSSSDPLSRGALVTTHKIDLHAACHDLFDAVDPLCGTDGRNQLHFEAERQVWSRHAKDPISVRPDPGWFPARQSLSRHRRGAAPRIGAGGSTIAITWHLSRRTRRAIGRATSSSLTAITPPR